MQLFNLVRTVRHGWRHACKSNFAAKTSIFERRVVRDAKGVLFFRSGGVSPAAGVREHRLS